jgi:hypothetical protein
LPEGELETCEGREASPAVDSPLPQREELEDEDAAEAASSVSAMEDSTGSVSASDALATAPWRRAAPGADDAAGRAETASEHLVPNPPLEAPSAAVVAAAAAARPPLPPPSIRRTSTPAVAVEATEQPADGSVAAAGALGIPVEIWRDPWFELRALKRRFYAFCTLCDCWFDWHHLQGERHHRQWMARLHERFSRLSENERVSDWSGAVVASAPEGAVAASAPEVAEEGAVAASAPAAKKPKTY